MNVLVDYEPWVRGGSFVLALALSAVAERTWPVRDDARPAARQRINLALVAGNTALLRLAFPLLAVTLAFAVHARGGGLLGAVSWPAGVEVVLAVLALDATIYWQHRLLHVVPLLWPVHRVHHSDLAIDATTGVRFHPIEISLSMGLKLGAVAILGPDPAAVILFECLLSAGSLLTHADTALPPSADLLIRRVLVTPSMHRVHHSLRRDETDSNYGSVFSVWDRLFRSYCAASRLPERTMPVGLRVLRDPDALGLPALLVQPFRHLPDAGDPCDKNPSDA